MIINCLYESISVEVLQPACYMYTYMYMHNNLKVKYKYCNVMINLYVQIWHDLIFKRLLVLFALVISELAKNLKYVLVIHTSLYCSLIVVIGIMVT